MANQNIAQEKKNTWDSYIKEINFNGIGGIRYKKAKKEILEIFSNYCKVYQRISKNKQKISDSDASSKNSQVFTGFLSAEEKKELDQLTEDMKQKKINSSEGSPRYFELLNKKISVFKFFEDDIDHFTLKESANFEKLKKINSRKLTWDQKNELRELELKNQLILNKNSFKEKNSSNNKDEILLYASENAGIVEEYEIYKALNNITRLVKNNPQYDLKTDIDFVYGGNMGALALYSSLGTPTIYLSKEVLLKFASGNIATAMESVNHELTHHFQNININAKSKTKGIANLDNIKNDSQINQHGKSKHFENAIKYLYDNCDLIDASQQNYSLVERLREIKNSSKDPQEKENLLIGLKNQICYGWYYSLSDEIDARNGELKITNSTFNNFIENIEDDELKNYLNSQLESLNDSSAKEQKGIDNDMNVYDQFADILKISGLNLMQHPESTYQKISQPNNDFDNEERKKISKQFDSLSRLQGEVTSNEEVIKYFKSLENDKSVTANEVSELFQIERYKVAANNLSTKAILNILNNSLEKLDKTDIEFYSNTDDNDVMDDYSEFFIIDGFIKDINSTIFGSHDDLSLTNEKEVNKDRYKELYNELFSDPEKYKKIIKYLAVNHREFLYGYDKNNKSQFVEYLKKKPDKFIIQNVYLPFKDDKELCGSILSVINKDNPKKAKKIEAKTQAPQKLPQGAESKEPEPVGPEF